VSYRDAFAARLEAFRLRREQLANDLASITTAERAVLPDSDRDALVRSAGVLAQAPSTLDALEIAEAAMKDAEITVAHAKQLATTLLSGGATLPAVDGVSMPMDSVGKILRLALPNAVVTYEGDVVIAHATIDAVRVELRGLLQWTSDDLIKRLRLEVVSHLPATLGALEVRPQGTLDGIARALRLASEHELGDRSFDERYWVTGQVDAVHALLTKEVRDLLVALARLSPTLRIEAGTARLAWTIESWQEVFAAVRELFLTSAGPRTRALVPEAALAMPHALRAALTGG
jgi:hypothetical protein